MIMNTRDFECGFQGRLLKMCIGNTVLILCNQDIYYRAIFVDWLHGLDLRQPPLDDEGSL